MLFIFQNCNQCSNASDRFQDQSYVKAFQHWLGLFLVVASTQDHLLWADSPQGKAGGKVEQVLDHLLREVDECRN